MGQFLTTQQKEVLKVYESDGGYVPSVTTVLDCFSERWIREWRESVGAEEADRRLLEGQILGSRVHEVAQRIAEFGCRPRQCACGGCDEDLKPYHRAICRFMSTYVEEVLEIEQTLSSGVLGVGGTLDLRVRLRDGTLAIVDYKTGKRISEKNSVQLAAYSLLWQLEKGRDNGSFEHHKRILVHLPKERSGEYHLKVFDDDGEAEADIFVAMVKVWYHFNGSSLENPLKVWSA